MGNVSAFPTAMYMMNPIQADLHSCDAINEKLFLIADKNECPVVISGKIVCSWKLVLSNVVIVLSVVVSVEINKRHSMSTVYTLQSMNYYKTSEFEMTQVDFSKSNANGNKTKV